MLHKAIVARLADKNADKVAHKKNMSRVKFESGVTRTIRVRLEEAVKQVERGGSVVMVVEDKALPFLLQVTQSSQFKDTIKVISVKGETNKFIVLKAGEELWS